MKSLILFSTSGCHLCEDAMALLEQLGANYAVQDIIDDSQLVEKYGTKIPVLKDNLGNELDWPFDLVMLKQFLEV